MKDQRIEELVAALRERVNQVNDIMTVLHEHNVEVRIAYKDPSKGEPPSIDLWRVIEHNDYLKDTNEKR